MIVKSLELDFFRNYVHLEAVFDPRVNLIYGDNAQGKTNLLEAVAYLSTASVPPGPVRPGDDHAGSGWGLCQGRGALPGPDFTLEARLNRGPAPAVVQRGAAEDGGELSGILNTVLFCPEDLYLIREGGRPGAAFWTAPSASCGPGMSRHSASITASMTTRCAYSGTGRRTLSLLSTLDDFNLRMAQTGALIVHYRAHFIRRLQESAPAIHRDFSGERRSSPCGMRPSPPSQTPWPEPKPSCPSCWSTSRPIGRRSWTAVSVCPAPIRTTWQWRSTGTRPRPTAPRGRPARRPSPLKLAQREIFFQETGEWPVLLLDDVLSELDHRRQAFVLNRIQGGQVFISCCEEEKLEGLENGKSFHIHGGRLM